MDKSLEFRVCSSKTLLDRIINKKRERVEEAKQKTSLDELKRRVTLLPRTRDFKQALVKSDIAIIAEAKKASPSAGIIRENFNPIEIAAIYEKNGADAISVITEEDFFKGRDKYLKEIKSAISLPVLRKDFIFDPYQVYESRLIGADAILLIAAILDFDQLISLLSLAKQLTLNALVEVHTKEELNTVLKTDAVIIGINNRDLKNFKVDLDTSIKLAKHISKDKIIVSESGIKDRNQAEELQKAGVRAILVGESLLRSDDIGKQLKALKGL